VPPPFTFSNSMMTTQRTPVFSTILTITSEYFLIPSYGKDSVYYGVEALCLYGIQASEIQKATATSLLAIHRDTHAHTHPFIVHQADQDTGKSIEIKHYLPSFFLVLPISLVYVGLRIKY
jgi:hypothetical protein